MNTHLVSPLRRALAFSTSVYRFIDVDQLMGFDYYYQDGEFDIVDLEIAYFASEFWRERPSLPGCQVFDAIYHNGREPATLYELVFAARTLARRNELRSRLVIPYEEETFMCLDPFAIRNLIPLGTRFRVGNQIWRDQYFGLWLVENDQYLTPDDRYLLHI